MYDGTRMVLPDQQCSSCVFKPESGFNMTQLRARWQVEGGHQVCHKWGTEDNGKLLGADVWCRGFWDNEAPDDVKQLATLCGWVRTVPQKKC